MKKISVNQFNKGLNLDNNPVSVSNDSLIGALNATFITKNGNEVVLQNDMGNASVDKAQLPAGYVPIGAKEHGGIIYIASYNPLTDKSQIGCFPSPQRNFATNSDKSLGFKSLCEYDGNITYEQKIVEISDDNIIRPGDKFIITATESQIADFENYPQYIRLKVLVITSDNQSIDITNELVEPSGHFEHVKFVKNIESDIESDIPDTDYTIYSNKTCGQLCLRAELIIPSKIELSYFAEYKKISELFPNDYQTKIDEWRTWSTNHDDSPITPDLINQDTHVTSLHVKVTPYDEQGNIFTQNTISGYESDVSITDGYIYHYQSDNQGNFYYLIYGESDNSIINFNYTPYYEYLPSDCQVTISSLKRSEQVELSLIGSGKVTFNTFRYFNDFDNNHLVLNYGLKFYQRNSDYKLTDLYLELINLRDLNSHNWDYTNQDLKIKRISLNTENTYGTYTEIIDYFNIDYLTVNTLNQLDFNNNQSFTILMDSSKINVGQYYLARICAKVDGTTLYKGDWHALLTSEATNYIYNNGEYDMLNLQKEDAIEYINNQDPYNTNDPNNKILLNYTLNDTNEIIDNYEERLSGNCDNYFSDSRPQNSELRFEIEKSSETTFEHSATSSLIIPKSFPFSQSEINYTPTVIPDIEKEGDRAFVHYQDDIEIRRGNNYTTNGTVEHYDTGIIADGQKIGGNNSPIQSGKNEVQFNFVPGGTQCNIHINYKLYSQLFTPFEIENNDYKQRTYNGQGLVFKPYIENNDDLATLLNQQSVTEDSNKIYPENKLYCIYEYRIVPYVGTAASVGLVGYGINSSSNSDEVRLYAMTELYIIHPAGSFANAVNMDIYPNDPDISTFINNNANNPNIYIFSSCITGDNVKSDSLLNGNNMITEYDMILLKGDDDKMYLLDDIETTKGILLNKFKSCFSKIYVPKDNQPITLNYYRGNKNNYFITNNYKITISYNINYRNTSNININNYDPNRIQTLDSSSIRLPNIKFNENIITKHFNQIIRPINIDEQVINFLENSSDGIILGNIAVVNGQYVYYAKNPNPNNNNHESFNIGDSYIKLFDDSNDLYNCRNVNLPSTSPLYNIVDAIKNNYIKQDNSFKFVLNVGNVPNNQLSYRFGYKEYLLKDIFNLNTRNIKLLY